MNMLRIIKIFLVFLIIICINSTFNFNKVNATTNNSSEIIIEKNSKRILYEYNANEKKPMASTTKILTALTVIENCNLEEKITVTEKTIGIEGSSIYLEKGEVLSVKDLLYGLMLRSGNDCAETLAVYLSNNIEKFSILMNKKAKELGALNSNFVNPHGLHDENHYTTAYDLALISASAMQNKQFKQIVSTKSIYIPFTTRNTKRYLVNKNKLLSNLDGATGIKTGYTKKAGRCLVSACERDNMELICVVLNCPPMFERSTNLINEAFNKYSLKKLIESDNILGFTNYKEQKIALHVKNDIILPLTETEYKNVKICFEYPKNIETLPKNHSEIGVVKIYIENNLIFTEKIFTI